jgi:hypothetical protein
MGPIGKTGATGSTGKTGATGSAGINGSSLVTLLPNNLCTIDLPNSFTFLNGSDDTTNVSSLESYDSSQGLYMQVGIPAYSGNSYYINLGLDGLDNSYGIKISNDISDIGAYELYYNNNNTLYLGTYSSAFRFSLYSDGKYVYYEIDGNTIISTTYSVDNYYFYSHPIITLANDITFTDVFYYPTGKRGIAGDKYTGTSSTYITIPPTEGVVVLDTQPELAYTPGQWLFISNSQDSYYTIGNYYDDDALGTNFYAVIDTYNSVTGELIVVCEKSNSIGGTASSWYINISGEPGPVGATGSGLSFSAPYQYGLLTSDGSLNGVNIENNLTFTGNTFSVIGDTLLEGTTQFQQTIEILNTPDTNLGTSPSTVTYDYTLGSIWIHNDLVDNYYANFINIPITDNRAITTTLIINQGATAFMPIVLAINGDVYEIYWANGDIPTGNANQTDVIGLSFINYGIFRVLGQMSTFLTTVALPTVTSDGISSGFPCVADGTVVNEGGSSVTEMGFVYATHNTPTIADTRVTASNPGIGSFSVDITVPPYPYSYGRAYAINSAGVAYGVEIGFSGPCFAKGTLVTLSDGSTKKIEDITYDDSLLVWNFDESKFDSAKPVWMMNPVTISNTFISKFSDGSELITEGKIGFKKTSHRIFNLEKGEFTYLISEQDTPIGTHTFNDKGEIVTLISREPNKGLTQIYHIVTFGHLNMFCNTLLTSVRLNNLYPIKDMKFVKDNREIIPFDKFEGLTKDYYDGFRLGEQPLVQVSENFAITNTTPTLEELIQHMKTYYK